MLHKIIQWIDSRLHRKYVLGMTSGLVAISLAFAALFIGMYQQQLKNERASTSLNLNKLLQTALEHSMIRRDLEGARDILTRFGKQDEISNVMVLNPAGEVRLSSNSTLVGQVDETLGSATRQYTLFMQTAQDNDKEAKEVLRSVNPIYNREECAECHESAEYHPINGVLVVDYDAGIIRESARDTTLALMGAGSTVVVITLLGGWWFMGQFVLRPVRHLLGAQQSFTDGDKTARVNIKGRDEIARLGHSFNAMAQTIEAQWHTLEKRRQFLQSLIDGIPDGVRVIDQDYTILLANQAYASQFGSSMKDALALPCFASHDRSEPCIPTLETCPLHEISYTGKPVKTIHQHVNCRGEQQPVEIFAAPIDNDDAWGKPPIVIEVIRDLSKSINYSQEQRLSSLGMLASGVAHEIHNPLASIQIAFQTIDQLIESDAPHIDQLKSYIQLIEGEIDKCVSITGRLLKLGNLPDTHLQPINLCTVIQETASLLRYEARARKIEMVLDLPEQAARVQGTDNELRMMILNLVQNAYHAMPEGGVIRIALKKAADRLHITIEDNGVGIPEQNLKRIFHPFFTHRSDHEKGSGLGLAITQSIIQQFNGQIQVASQLGKGTCFTVTFPDADADDDTDAEIDAETDDESKTDSNNTS